MPGAGDLISGNDSRDINLSRGSSGATVQGNFVGTQVDGTGDLGSCRRDGVRILDATNNTVGGDTAAAANVISGNDENGVLIEETTSTGNVILGNLIGTDVSGTTAVANTGSGVVIVSANDNTIGGSIAGSGNLIAGNNLAGVSVSGPDARNNNIQGNWIGTDLTGAATLANGGNGIDVSAGAVGNAIGGTAALQANVISGNVGAGVRISDPQSEGNRVVGNFIGTNAAGAMLGNGSHGILAIGSGANEIGGSEAGAGNTIAFNGGDGIAVVFAESFSFFKFIRQNSTFQNVGLGIDLEDDGVTLNDPGDTDIGANDLYNFPVFETVSLSGGELTLTGFARPDAQIELFIADPDPTGFGEGRVT